MVIRARKACVSDMDNRAFPLEGVLAEAVSRRWHTLSESEASLVGTIVSDGHAEVGDLNDPVPTEPTSVVSFARTKYLRADFLFWLLDHELIKQLLRRKNVIVRGVSVAGPYFPEHRALPLEFHFVNCRFEHCHLDGLQAISLSFMGCRFAGLSCNGVSLQTDLFLSDCALPGLNVERASIRGDFHILQVDALHLMGRRASVGGTLSLATRPESVGPVVVHLENASIDALSCSGPGFQFLSLKQAEIATDLSISVTFVEGHTGMNGASLEQMDVQGTLSWLAQPSHDTRLDLSHTKVRVLRDTRGSLVSYPLLEIAGLMYEDIELVEKFDGGTSLVRGSAALLHRWSWLATQAPWRFSFQPYAQFAALLERQGHTADSVQTLIRGVEDQRSRTRTAWTSKLWTLVSRLTVGHGYRPQRSLAWITAFVVLGVVVFGKAKAEGLLVPERPPEVTTFSAIAYSIDTFLPIIDLRQEKYWIASGVGLRGTLVQVYSWVHAACGWALSTLAVAAFSGILKKRT
jgi:hypothetical protein